MEPENKETKEAKDIKEKPKAAFLDLEMHGSLIRLKLKDKKYFTFAHRFEKLFEFAAKISDEPYRLFFYKMICALLLTSHAKKLQIPEIRKHIFDVKNRIIQSLLNDFTNRWKLSYVYLKSKNFRVEQYCPTCAKENETIEREKWKFCEKCKVDWKFYDVVCIQHFFKSGKLNLFLGGDQRNKFPKKLLKKNGKLEDYAEELIIEENLHFSSKNLSAIDLKSTVDMSEQLLLK